ncbi:hypothetical protein [Algicella marina]|uniref:Uncharacterized protein n=1 Tax=Algicella marina TaxID=2683284 RepID=A0A6P1SVW1_9RHOB|nr:hypothetical protein [Algicella marina]QHQ33897.1 hypothetical protein GO499_01220 [Algicella marina]
MANIPYGLESNGAFPAPGVKSNTAAPDSRPSPVAYALAFLMSWRQHPALSGAFSSHAA